MKWLHCCCCHNENTITRHIWIRSCAAFSWSQHCSLAFLFFPTACGAYLHNTSFSSKSKTCIVNVLPSVCCYLLWEIAAESEWLLDAVWMAMQNIALLHKQWHKAHLRRQICQHVCVCVCDACVRACKCTHACDCRVWLYAEDSQGRVPGGFVNMHSCLHAWLISLANVSMYGIRM